MERGCLYADSIVWRNVHSRRVCTVYERWSKAFEDFGDVVRHGEGDSVEGPVKDNRKS